MDEECYVNCNSMKIQTTAQMNECGVSNKVNEDIGDSNWISSLPGVPMLKLRAADGTV